MWLEMFDIEVLYYKKRKKEKNIELMSKERKIWHMSQKKKVSVSFYGGENRLILIRLILSELL